MTPCSCRALLPSIGFKYENCIKLQLVWGKRRSLVADVMLPMKERENIQLLLKNDLIMDTLHTIRDQEHW